jgi:hypothetical protein
MRIDAHKTRTAGGQNGESMLAELKNLEWRMGFLRFFKNDEFATATGFLESW